MLMYYMYIPLFRALTKSLFITHKLNRLELMPTPVELKLHRQSNVLDITFDNGIKAQLTSEFLRVHSPSAEVKGHGPGQEVLQIGKENVAINNIEAVGNYAVRLTFSDGHNSGLFTWDYLYELATEQDNLWQMYLDKLKEAGYTRRESSGSAMAGVEKYKP